LRLLLARAYLDDSNDFWAQRTVAAAAELHPEDCNLQLWLAWIQIRQGALDQARTLLDGACSHWQPEQGRRALLLAMLEQQAGSPAEAQARLDRSAWGRAGLSRGSCGHQPAARRAGAGLFAAILGPAGPEPGLGCQRTRRLA
jgi:hypothetical protein